MDIKIWAIGLRKLQKMQGDNPYNLNVAKVLVLRRWGGQTSVKQGENKADF